jgi:mono/diheme cytochrome c family protein
MSELNGAGHSRLSFSRLAYSRSSHSRLALGAAVVLACGMVGANTRAQDAPGGKTSVQVSAEGKQVYEEICQACHMADARGGGGAGAMIPALAMNPRLADKTYPVMVVVKGRGGMPWFTDMLSDQQMAAVLTYVRGHFNAYADPVTVADIQQAKTSPAPVPDCNCTQ